MIQTEPRTIKNYGSPSDESNGSLGSFELQGQIRVRFEFDRVIPQFSIQPNFLHQLTNDASPHSPKVLEGAPS